MRRGRGNTRGGVAVVVLTVVLLFALLGVTLYSVTRLQPPEVRTGGDRARALHLAEAGIQRAIEELPGAAARPWQGRLAAEPGRAPGEPWTYWGEDANANGRLDAGEDADGDGVLDTVSAPLDTAARPSLAAGRADLPESVMVQGRQCGVSGFLPGRYQPQGDQYVLRITDAASRIWINGPADRTQRMLTHLARRIGLDPAVAALVIMRRPPQGWRTEEDLIPSIGEPAWRALEPFVTATAWVDPRTLAICPPEDRIVPLRPGDFVYALGDIRPHSLQAQPRAPINLNTAPPEVLAAALEGVQGVWIEESPGRPPGVTGFGVGYEWMERPLPWGSPPAAFGLLRASPPVTPDQAATLAAALADRRTRTPFRSWDDLAQFLAEQVASGLLSTPQAEAIRANADPNALLNDFNPDRAAWTPIDKTDLLTGTTEFCFQSMGFFVVESLGRVLDPGGRVLARALKKTHVQVYEVWRETVEEEFLASVAEGGSPESQIETYKGEGATRDGLALEALPDVAERGMLASLWYDGRIGLAPLIIPGGRETWLRASLTPPKPGALAADDFRAPGADAGPADMDIRNLRPQPPPWARATLRDILRRMRAQAEEKRQIRLSRAANPHPSGDPQTGPLVNRAPGNHFCDGAYLERDSSLRWRAMDNLPRQADGQTRSGCISFWFKPAFDPERASRPRTLWSLDRNRLGTSPGLVDSSPFGAYLFPPGPEGLISEGPYDYGLRLEGVVGFGIGYKESFAGQGGAGRERDWVAAGILTGRAEYAQIRPHQWVHLAFAWDFDRPCEQAFRMAVNGRLVPAVNAFEQVPGSLPMRGRIDLSVHGGQPPMIREWEESDVSTWISLGALGSDPQRNFALDGTVDEIRVGTLEAFESARRDAVEGRYARVDDKWGGARDGAVFTSAARRLALPATPGSIAWTVRSPASLLDSAVRLEFYDGRRWRGPFNDAGGEALGEAAEVPTEAGAEFRYRATFTTGARRDQPVLETPYLDDVTITYVMKPRIVSWSSPPLGRVE
ncbi:MAG: hypothetical protein HYY18_19070 [Planctomycetes bacterium]|nr:hypothetical protein [Planctomycetota bacterium]